MIQRILLFVLFVVCAVTFVFPADAAIIGFEDIAVLPGENDRAGDRESGGFLFDSTSDHSHLINAYLGADNGTTYLAIDDHYGPAVLWITSLTDEPFALSSFDIGEWSAIDGDNATHVRVTAYTTADVEYTRVINLDGIFDGIGPLIDFETFTFDSWFDLRKIAIVGSGGYRGGAFAIDNLSMPEPAGVFFMMAAVAYHSFRRK